MAGKSFVFRFADVEVREREFSLIKEGERLAVEPKAFRVLLILIRNPGKLIPKQELLDAVWGDAAVTENSLARAVGLLRKLLGDEVHSPRFIETVSTVGYRFVGSVDAVEDAAAGTVMPEPAAPVATATEANTAALASPHAKEAVRRRPARIGLFAAGALAALVVAGGMWYAARPLPSPRVTEYIRLTNDGHIGNLIGTDGNRIYFNLDPWGPVEQVGVTGGDIVSVPTGSMHVWGQGLSADGANLLLWSPDPNRLWTVGTLGGSPRFIADATGRCSYAWSPDTKYIAYSDCHGTLLAMRSDGTDIRNLVTVKDGITGIAWSPDGGRIRFTVDDSLWEISSSGGNLHPVLPDWKGPVGPCCGRWTADGDFYLFLARGDNKIGVHFEQIWVLDERHPLFRRVSRAPLQLVSGPIHWDTPLPSRDGAKIFVQGTTPRGELVRFDAKSKALQPLLGGISAEFLAFSKDGSRLAYVTYPDGILWRAKADGTERVQLTNPPLYPIVCRWSPDGTHILFTAQRDSSHYGLYTISAQGGSPAPIVPAETGGRGSDGNWSPDGHRIVYDDQPSNMSLWIFDLDSRKATKVPGSDGLFSPRWSPDGRYIAAMTVPSQAIRLFDLQTQQWSTLVEHKGGWGFPTWSHNSGFIYALNQSAPWSVYRIAVPAGKPELVVDLTNVHLVGAVSFWFGLDPNDTPLLLRNNGTTDIYALTLER